MKIEWHQIPADELLEIFQVKKDRGLSFAQVAQLRKKYGPNALPQKKRKTIALIFFNQFKSPLIYLLLIAALVALLVGAQKDAWVIFCVVLLNGLIGSFQERRAEASLESLRGLSKLKARVLREGKELEITAEELVPGDIFF